MCFFFFFFFIKWIRTFQDFFFFLHRRNNKKWNRSYEMNNLISSARYSHMKAVLFLNYYGEEGSVAGIVTSCNRTANMLLVKISQKEEAAFLSYG